MYEPVCCLQTKWLIMKGEMVQRGEGIPVASGESEVDHTNSGPSIPR